MSANPSTTALACGLRDDAAARATISRPEAPTILETWDDALLGRFPDRTSCILWPPRKDSWAPADTGAVDGDDGETRDREGSLADDSRRVESRADGSRRVESRADGSRRIESRADGSRRIESRADGSRRVESRTE
jgi:hypothetical protein